MRDFTNCDFVIFRDIFFLKIHCEIENIWADGRVSSNYLDVSGTVKKLASRTGNRLLCTFVWVSDTVLGLYGAKNQTYPESMHYMLTLNSSQLPRYYSNCSYAVPKQLLRKSIWELHVLCFFWPPIFVNKRAGRNFEKWLVSVVLVRKHSWINLYCTVNTHGINSKQNSEQKSIFCFRSTFSKPYIFLCIPTQGPSNSLLLQV